MSDPSTAATSSTPDIPLLDPPKDDPISKADLAKYDGSGPTKEIYVAIKGTVFDVTRNFSKYGPDGGYHIFAGKDASRGLGMSSLKPEDVTPLSPGERLDEQHQKVLDEWFEFFRKRYNIVGRLVD